LSLEEWKALFGKLEEEDGDDEADNDKEKLVLH
jgi:hypothetical protein